MSAITDALDAKWTEKSQDESTGSGYTTSFIIG